jgi:hypothetical protein
MPIHKSEGKNKMNKLLLTLIVGFAFIGCQPMNAAKNFTDMHYYGYKISHHMGVQVTHMKEFGFNKFDHPRIANYESFVITPALDHFYSKAVVDMRSGPVIVDTPPKDDRYSSLEIFDHEHFAIFDEVTPKEGKRYVLVHQDYKGDIPEGAVIKVNANFPLVFLRTQSFNFNDDKKADEIRRQAKITGKFLPVDLPDPKDTQALIKWATDNAVPYPETKGLVAEAIKIYTPEVHAQTFEHVKEFLSSGQVIGNVGMFEPLYHPAGGSHQFRAAGTLLGHLGFPVHHAYYQQLPMDRKGNRLSGTNGTFVITLPHDPGMDEFWSLTRYDADNFLPLNPADLGGHDIQAYNQFNTKPDSNGNVTFTMSISDPNDGTYWMPVKDTGYYLIARYYGPNPNINGKTAADLVYKGTKLEEKFKAVQF